MRAITEVEATQRFWEILAAAERGEYFVITRGGRRIAIFGPPPESVDREGDTEVEGRLR